MLLVAEGSSASPLYGITDCSTRLSDFIGLLLATIGVA
jgi:hypothetical protein